MNPTTFSAAKTVSTATITREAAAALLAAARTAAAESGFEAAVAVTDTGGYLRAFERGDGAPALTADIALNKAYTAATSGRATHVWQAIVADPSAAQLAHTPRLVAAAGGYPILANGMVVGDWALRAARPNRTRLSRSRPCGRSASTCSRGCFQRKQGVVKQLGKNLRFGS